jgi:hypothetical protein
MAEFIFDLARNSVEAGSKNIRVSVSEDMSSNIFAIVIEDDGTGMTEEQAGKATSPFYTTRPANRRRVGLGLSLMDVACRRCGGELVVESVHRRGTTVTATMEHDNIDRPPMGDLAGTFASLMMSTVENGIIWTLEHSVGKGGYSLKNRKTMDELNILSFKEEGVRDKLLKLIDDKERVRKRGKSA